MWINYKGVCYNIAQLLKIDLSDSSRVTITTSDGKRIRIQEIDPEMVEGKCFHCHEKRRRVDYRHPQQLVPGSRYRVADVQVGNRAARVHDDRGGSGERRVRRCRACAAAHLTVVASENKNFSEFTAFRLTGHLA